VEAGPYGAGVRFEVTVPAVLAVWTPEDGLLGALAPLGLAAAGGSALVVDLDPGGPAYPGPRSLADLAGDGPRRTELEPERGGVAVLRNGGIAAADAADVVRALIGRWPRVVLRLPPRPAVAGPGVPTVVVRLLAPGGLYPAGSRPAVYQATPHPMQLPGPGVRLPVPSRRTTAALLTGRMPAAGSRWVRAWRRVWEVPWTR
jgi:hypothetical protein